MKGSNDLKKPVPQVLVRAKADAKHTSTAGIQGKNSWDRGPWDKGHWANRK